MKRVILTFLAIASLQFMSSAQLTVKDPNAEARTAKDFHRIKLDNAFEVYLVQGNEEGVVVSASDPKYSSDIIVEVNNGTLHIGMARNRFSFNNRKLKAYISFKNIDDLDINGACNVRIDGMIKASGLNISLSGASNIKGKLVADNISVNLNGASDANLTGEVKNLKVEAGGASNFKGYDLSAQYCAAKASGASDIKITVNKELSAHAGGASAIRYKGDAVIRDLHTGGASKVDHAG